MRTEAREVIRGQGGNDVSTFEEIDKERRLLDLSQKELCARARVWPSTYVRLKKGRTRRPGDRTLARLANALAAVRQSREAAE